MYLSVLIKKITLNLFNIVNSLTIYIKIVKSTLWDFRGSSSASVLSGSNLLNIYGPASERIKQYPAKGLSGSETPFPLLFQLLAAETLSLEYQDYLLRKAALILYINSRKSESLTLKNYERIYHQNTGVFFLSFVISLKW